MTDSEAMLRRQAQWQKDRRSLSWPEKIRMAERVRESAERLRDRPGPARTPPPSGPARRPYLPTGDALSSESRP